MLILLISILYALLEAGGKHNIFLCQLSKFRYYIIKRYFLTLSNTNSQTHRNIELSTLVTSSRAPGHQMEAIQPNMAEIVECRNGALK